MPSLALSREREGGRGDGEGEVMVRWREGERGDGEMVRGREGERESEGQLGEEKRGGSRRGRGEGRRD